MVETRRDAPSRSTADEPVRLHRETVVDDDEAMVSNDDPLTEYETFAGLGDENSSERRRDPLR